VESFVVIVMALWCREIRSGKLW